MNNPGDVDVRAVSLRRQKSSGGEVDEPGFLTWVAVLTNSDRDSFWIYRLRFDRVC